MIENDRGRPLKKCGTCSEFMSAERPLRNRFAEHVSSICYERCDITGCNQILLNGTQEKHKETCSYIRVNCGLMNAGCTWSGYINEQTTHHEYCKVARKSKEEIAALLDVRVNGSSSAACIYQMAGCDWCGEKRNKQKHEQEDCTYSTFSPFELAREVEQEQKRLREEKQQREEFDDGMGPTSFIEDFYDEENVNPRYYLSGNIRFLIPPGVSEDQFRQMIDGSYSPASPSYSPTSPSYAVDEDDDYEDQVIVIE